ncbi:hypothetical protein BJ973_000098 [Actinoplanes tereljensis]|uniref:Uncharacterized protein n=1 Tax=Paractinoplanes tereljensis TaxID=571912 RepID=A0A919U004_9ACTN|nr:hypothetical protein Ate02nite_95400 [Actinoplanes tereljensis]
MISGHGAIKMRVGRFPRGRRELPDEPVDLVARLVGADPAELGLYEWTGSTITYRWAQSGAISASVSARWPMPTS